MKVRFFLPTKNVIMFQPKTNDIARCEIVAIFFRVFGTVYNCNLWHSKTTVKTIYLRQGYANFDLRPYYQLKTIIYLVTNDLFGEMVLLLQWSSEKWNIIQVSNFIQLPILIAVLHMVDKSIANFLKH